MQGNQNLLCGAVMRSNCCCCDSHSTTRWVSSKKVSISSAARTRTCRPPLLLLLLWDVAGFRGQRLAVEGWGDGVIVSESMQICRPHENGRAAFLDFSTLTPVFKKVPFQALRFQDPCGRTAQMMQYVCVFAKERFCVDCTTSSASCTWQMETVILPICKSCVLAARHMIRGIFLLPVAIDLWEWNMTEFEVGEELQKPLSTWQKHTRRQNTVVCAEMWHDMTWQYWPHVAWHNTA